MFILLFIELFNAIFNYLLMLPNICKEWMTTQKLINRLLSFDNTRATQNMKILREEHTVTKRASSFHKFPTKI